MGTRIMMAAASTGGAENALASIDVPLGGNIVGVTWSGYTDLDTDNDLQLWQLSFGSAYTNQNDSRQVISMASAGSLTFTAGGSVVGIQNYHDAIPDIPVGMGERLYLHSSASAGVVSTMRCLISFDFDLDKVAVRRR